MNLKRSLLALLLAVGLLFTANGVAEGTWYLAVVQQPSPVYLDAAGTHQVDTIGAGEVVYMEQGVTDRFAVCYASGYLIRQGYMDKGSLMAMTEQEAALYQVFAADGCSYNGVRLRNIGENAAFTGTLFVQDTAGAELMTAEEVSQAVNGAADNGDPGKRDWMILAQPKVQHSRVGEKAVFTVTADNVAEFLWQYTTDGVEWKDTTTKKNTLTLTTSTTNLKRKYRCRLQDNSGRIVFTDEVWIESAGESDLVVFLAQPQYYTAALGEIAAFYVNATNAAGYQWQIKTDSYWENCELEGSNSQTLLVPVTYPRLMYKYRCVVTGKDMREAISAEAGLNISESPSLVLTSRTPDLSARVDEEVTFTVEAENAVSYQWLYTTSRKSDIWYKLTIKGADTNTLTFKATSGRFKQRFKCLIMDADGTGIYSEPVVVDEIKE